MVKEGIIWKKYIDYLPVLKSMYRDGLMDPKPIRDLEICSFLDHELSKDGRCYQDVMLECEMKFHLSQRHLRHIYRKFSSE